MAIDFQTADPKKLLNTFVNAVKAGHVQTWARDSDGDFYHTAAGGQWAKNGYLRPKIISGCLHMTFLAHPSHKTTWPDLGVIQARFVESMMSHCHELFTVANVSAKPAAGDNVG